MYLLSDQLLYVTLLLQHITMLDCFAHRYGSTTTPFSIEEDIKQYL